MSISPSEAAFLEHNSCLQPRISLLKSDKWVTLSLHQKKKEAYSYFTVIKPLLILKKNYLVSNQEKVYGINHTLPFYSHDFFFNAIDNKKN